MRITVRRLKTMPKSMYRLLIPVRLARVYNLWQHGRLLKRTEYIKKNKDSGIYYFLGNFHQHMSHVIPLYKFIGGTVVVLSASAKKEVEKYGVKCICIDDNKEIWLDLDRSIKNTINFLDQNASIVILYDAFYWKDIEIGAPTLWLGHGIGIVKGAIWDKRRLEELNRLSAVATLGELGRAMLDGKVESQKMKKLSPSRVDEITSASAMSRGQRLKLKKSMKLPTNRTTVTYMPTYWGPSSVEDTGLEIVKNIAEDKVVIFWPHPQTPVEIIKKYEKIMKKSRNIIDGRKFKNISITDVYAVTDKFIVDHTSSVSIDVMLLGRPMFFAFGQGDNYDYTVETSPLRRLVRNSINITVDNVDEINTLLNSNNTVLAKLMRRTLIYRFTWFPHGGATTKIVETINEISSFDSRSVKKGEL